MGRVSLAEGAPSVLQLDPRARIIGAFILSGVSALSPNLYGSAIAFSAGIALCCFMVRPIARLLKRLLAVNLLLALLWFTLPVSTPGVPLHSLGPFTVTQEGVQLTILVTIKANAAALFMLALLGTDDPIHLAQGMRALGSSSKLALLFALTTRYLGLVLEEYERVRRAMAARGFSPKATLRDYKILANSAAISFLRGADRAEHIRRAMLCRGFAGSTAAVGSLRFKKTDAAFSLIGTAVSLLIIVVGWGHG